jgi:NAD(P)-dependent dehydrogenase (short-subunit alcohol dehydrogenase family)
LTLGKDAPCQLKTLLLGIELTMRWSLGSVWLDPSSGNDRSAWSHLQDRTGNRFCPGKAIEHARNNREVRMSQKVLGGRAAFITGGSGGFGVATARLFLRDGAAVLLMARNADALAAARNGLLAEFPEGRIEVRSGDACDGQDVQAGLAQASAMTGRLDMIVPTVGGGGFLPLLMHDEKSFMGELELNVKSAFLAIRYGVPYMTEGGAIVCVSSTAAVLPSRGLSAYCTAKGGLEQLVRTAADELADAGVRVNSVRPGISRTVGTGPMFDTPSIIEPYVEQIPLRRGGEANDLAEAIRYLAGPESAWVTGQSLAVDGGQELRRNPDGMPLLRSLFGEDTIASVMRGKPAQVSDARPRDSHAMAEAAR